MENFPLVYLCPSSIMTLWSTGWAFTQKRSSVSDFFKYLLCRIRGTTIIIINNIRNKDTAAVSEIPSLVVLGSAVLNRGHCALY